MDKSVHTIILTLFLVVMFLSPSVPPGSVNYSYMASAAGPRNFDLDLNMSPPEIAKMRYIHIEEVKTANISIKNLGWQNDTIWLSITMNLIDHEGVGWEVWLESEEVKVRPQGINKTLVHLKGPTNGNMDDNISVTITAVSKGNNAVYDTVRFKCFLILDHKVDLDCTDNVHIAGAGERTEYKFNLKNSGDQIEDFEIVIKDKPMGWKAELSIRRVENVPPKDSRNLSLYVTPPRDGLMNDVGLVSIEARVVTFPTIRATVMTHTIVTCIPWVHLKTEWPRYTIDPGNNTLIPIMVRWAGSQDIQPLHLEITSILRNGWRASLERESFLLNPNSFEIVNLTVWAPARAQFNDRVNIRIESYGDTRNEWFDIISIDILTNRSIQLNITVAPKGIEAIPGETVKYNVTLTNDGPNDETFSLFNVSYENELRILFNDPSFSIYITSLKAGEALNFQVDVFVPEHARPGDWKNKIVLKDKLGKNWTIPLRTIIGRYHSFEVGLFYDDKLVPPGNTVFFGMEVINRGNCKDKFDLLIQDLPHNWTYRFMNQGNTTNTIQLKPGEIAELGLYIDVPGSWNYESIFFRLTVTGPSGITKTLWREFLVEGCELSLERISYDRHITRGKEVIIEVIVHNSGLVQCHDVAVSFYDDAVLQGTANLERLPPGITKTIVFGWKPMTAGGRKLIFMIDPDNKIKEANEDDNKRVDKITVPMHEYDGEGDSYLCIVCPAGIFYVIVLFILFGFAGRGPKTRTRYP